MSCAVPAVPATEGGCHPSSKIYSLDGDRRILDLSLSRSLGIPGLPQEEVAALSSDLFPVC